MMLGTTIPRLCEKCSQESEEKRGDGIAVNRGDVFVQVATRGRESAKTQWRMNEVLCSCVVTLWEHHGGQRMFFGLSTVLIAA